MKVGGSTSECDTIPGRQCMAALPTRYQMLAIKFRPLISDGNKNLKLILNRWAAVLASATRYLAGNAWRPASFFSSNLMMFSSISTGETHFEY